MKISTVIPVYNDAGHLKACLGSIQQALPQPFEILVVDDGSTQDMSFLGQEFPSVKVIRQETRMGPGHARHAGVLESRGDVIAFLDSDCRVRPDWFETIAVHLGEDLGGIVGGYIPCNLDHFVALYEAVDVLACYVRVRQKGRYSHSVPVVIGGCCAFWKRVLMDTDLKSTFVFGKIAAGEDTLLGLEVNRKYRIAAVESMKVYHHFHETWRQYFRKRWIDGFSYTVIFLLRHRDLRKDRHLEYAYIVAQLAATVLLFFLLERGHYWVIGLLLLGGFYAETGFFRILFSMKKVRWWRKLGIILIRPPGVLIRNLCWLTGVLGGLGYFGIHYEKLSRLSVPAKPDISA